MTPIAYPTELPITTIENLIAAIQSGNLAANRQAIAKDIWILEGYLLGHTFGEPGQTLPHVAASFAMPGVAVPATVEILSLLEQLITSAEGQKLLSEIAGGSAVLLKWALNKSLELLHLAPVPLPPAPYLPPAPAPAPPPPAPAPSGPAPSPALPIVQEDDATEAEPV